MRYLLTSLSMLIFSVGALSGQYAGRVFVDINSNGIIDPADKVLPGVAVTDGRNVVKTSPDGSFSLLGYERTRFITVTTPSGYSTDEYYIPVSQGAGPYDFLLSRNGEANAERHSFIQITDTEIFNRGVNQYWTGYLKSYIENHSPAFLIHTGDICYESGLREHIKTVNSHTMGCPVYYIAGNHDLVKGNYGEELFESIYGPSWFSFEVGNIHYVVTPMRGGDHRPGYTLDEVTRWLANDLAMMAPEKTLVVFNHDLLTAGNDFMFGRGANAVDLGKYSLGAWIYGHMHYNYVRDQGGVKTVCTAAPDKGGIDHSASAFRVFEMGAGGILSQKLKYTYLDKSVVIAVPQNGQRVPVSAGGNIPVSVNAYWSGGEVEKVLVSLPGGGKKNKMMSVELLPGGDWNWSGEVSAGKIPQGKPVTAFVTAYFSDGTSKTAQTEFFYSAANDPVVKTGIPWVSLLGNAEHNYPGDHGKVHGMEPRLVWTRNLGTPVFMAAPLIVGNSVYIATCDDSEGSGAFVAALDVVNGSELWRCPVRNSIKNSIAYDSGKILAQDASGYLYAIDAASGKVDWEILLLSSGYPYLAEGLAARHGIVYAGTGEGLSAYRIADGERLWINTAWKKNECATTTLTLGGGVLVAASQWGALYGHEASTGELLWKLTADGLSNRGGSAVYREGKFYIISGKNFFVIDPRSGQIISKKAFPDYSLDVTSSPVFTENEIVFGTAGTGLLAIDRETFNIKWNYITSPALVYTAPYTSLFSATVETSAVYKNGKLYAGASDGVFHGIDPATGMKSWSFESGAPFFASPAVSGNMMVTCDFAGNVYAFVSE